MQLLLMLCLCQYDKMFWNMCGWDILFVVSLPLWANLCFDGSLIAVLRAADSPWLRNFSQKPHLKKCSVKVVFTTKEPLSEKSVTQEETQKQLGNWCFFLWRIWCSKWGNEKLSGAYLTLQKIESHFPWNFPRATPRDEGTSKASPNSHRQLDGEVWVYKR